jgi:predicted AlkP superfamily pyrophosphatase or phosphodiesterase
MTEADEPTAGRVVVLDVVGLQTGHLDGGHAPNLAAFFDGALTADLRPPSPAVTLPAQTTLATGRSPSTHGDVANGEYDRDADAVAFWERDRGDRTRLWEAASDAGLTTGVLFFQHLVGTTADVAVTPSPIEDEDNTLVEMNCWTSPNGFYDDLRAEYGHFPLHRYWGPGADADSSEWILAAARETVARYDPDLLWVYLPHLDYDAQRHGPTDPAFADALETVDEMVGDFLAFLRGDDRWAETAVNVVSEYGFHDVDAPVFPNRALRDAGLLSVTPDGSGGEAVDLARSRAFAMVDHQVAHVYADADVVPRARRALAPLDGVDAVLGDGEKAAHGLDHPDAGDLVLLADPSAWFQYYWWDEPTAAPAYATDVDIHAKPGFDPCELFLGEDGLVSLDPARVGGSHGRVDDESLAFYGLAGPAAPVDHSLDGPVDARAVAPTLAARLGLADVPGLEFEHPPLFS